MARNGVTKKEGEKKDARFTQVRGGNDNFKGYIQHTLTKEEKDNYDLWLIVDDDIWNDLQVLVDNGYKVGIGYDGYNQTFQCSLTCNNSKDDNFGWVLVARAPDVYNCVRLVLYKHLVLLMGDWSTFHERAKESREWG